MLQEFEQQQIRPRENPVDFKRQMKAMFRKHYLSKKRMKRQLCYEILYPIVLGALFFYYFRYNTAYQRECPDPLNRDK